MEGFGGVPHNAGGGEIADGTLFLVDGGHGEGLVCVVGWCFLGAGAGPCPVHCPVNISGAWQWLLRR